MRIRDMLYMLLQKTQWENVEPSSSKLTSGFIRAFVDPIKGVAKVEGYFRATTNLTSSDVLFVLPEKYRSYMDTDVPAFLTTSDGAYAYTVRIKSNGEVTQRFGSLVREGMFSGTLPLNP